MFVVGQQCCERLLLARGDTVLCGLKQIHEREWAQVGVLEERRRRYRSPEGTLDPELHDDLWWPIRAG
jgi:hypothetical protein